jgi:hypothetical protein
MTTTTKTPTAKRATKKKAAAPRPSKPAATPKPISEDRMNDNLLAIRAIAKEIDQAREATDALVARSDALIREAVDDGERYRDIAAAAGRTVPWVQMSLRRVAGVSTHPAQPIPDTRIRKSRRAATAD